MITLENISTLRLKNSLEYSIDREVIENHRLVNYKLLKEFLQANGNSCFYRLKSAVYTAERNLRNFEDISMEELNENLFISNSYKNSNIDELTANITDRSVDGSRLVYFLPTVITSQKKDALSRYNIYELKELLSHVDINNEGLRLANSLRFEIGSFRNEDCERLINAINFYEKQVLQQYNENNKTCVNVFDLNRLEKEKIVEKIVDKIAKYIFESNQETVWGILKYNVKSEMISMLKNRRKFDSMIRKNFINQITDYTTLTELETLSVPEIGDKFLIKR